MEVWDTTPICQFCLSPLGLGEQCAVCDFAWEVQTTCVEMALVEMGARAPEEASYGW